jgi:hypothetical protein
MELQETKKMLLKYAKKCQCPVLLALQKNHKTRDALFA